MYKLFSPLLIITSILFVAGLVVYFHFNFIGAGYAGVIFSEPIRGIEEDTYWVVLIFLSVFTLLLNLSGREATKENTKNKDVVIKAKLIYLWITLLLTGLFVIAALLLALDSAVQGNVNLALFSSVSAIWACYIYKSIPNIELSNA